MDRLSRTRRPLPDVDTLTTWYREHARDLPWRRTSDPYEIWVSEVMLQQTQVASVVPRYHRFLERFPSVERLAKADLDQVRSEWAGLGYYRRCQNLWKGAGHVQATHGGELPRDLADLERIPGVGPYTAAAIAAVAFGLPRAAVDGNVLRVGARFLGMKLPADHRSLRREVQLWGDSVVARGQPSTLAQALMEVGATLCRPRRADCTGCPLGKDCAARATGDPTSMPLPARRRAPARWRAVLGVPVVTDGRISLRRRPEGGLLGGLWFPLGLAGPEEDPALRVALRSPEAAALEAAGIGAAQARAHAPVEATWRFTHILLRALVVRLDLRRGIEVSGAETRSLSAWEREALPSASRHLIRTVLAPDAGA